MKNQLYSSEIKHVIFKILGKRKNSDTTVHTDYHKRD